MEVGPDVDLIWQEENVSMVGCLALCAMTCRLGDPAEMTWGFCCFWTSAVCPALRVLTPPEPAPVHAGRAEGSAAKVCTPSHGKAWRIGRSWPFLC